MLLFQKANKLIIRKRWGKVVALRLIAPFSLQIGRFGLRFDPFGQHFDTYIMPEADDRRQDDIFFSLNAPSPFIRCRMLFHRKPAVERLFDLWKMAAVNCPRWNRLFLFAVDAAVPIGVSRWRCHEIYISWNFVLHPVERPLHSIKMTCYEGKQNRTIGKSLLQLIYIKFNGSSPKVVLDFF